MSHGGNGPAAKRNLFNLNGHYYTFTKENAKWDWAKKQSECGSGANPEAGCKQNGLTGYLATVTSAEEQNFIYKSSYHNGSTFTRIPNDGFLGATDVFWGDNTPVNATEGKWYWQGGPEQGEQFWDGWGDGSSVNGSYTNWDPGEPNNKKNQDFLQIRTIGETGYWDDVDPDNRGGYVTEWGRAGAEFKLGFMPPEDADHTNGKEGSSNAQIILHLEKDVPSDYKDKNGTPLIDIPLKLKLNGAGKVEDYYNIRVDGKSLGGAREESQYYINYNHSAYDHKTETLYIINTSNKAVTISFEPKSNETWQPLRTITAELSADTKPQGGDIIYEFDPDLTNKSQAWIFDDEPQLSLGQGAWQFVRTLHTAGGAGDLPSANTEFTSNTDTLIFDENGIDENNKTFEDLGLYDQFAVRWETYLRIPKDGNYTFKTTTNDGVILTVKNQSQSEEKAKIDRWKDQSSDKNYTTDSVKDLKAGDVLWVQYDFYSHTGDAKAQLKWDKGDGQGYEIIPAASMFLSKELATGTNQTEPNKNNSDALGFQVFANKDSNNKQLNILLSSTSQTDPTTVDTQLAQRDTNGTTSMGDDYQIKHEGSIIKTNEIGLNDEYGSMGTTITQEAFTQPSFLSLDLSVLTDPYAEITENVTLNLRENEGYGVGVMDDSSDSPEINYEVKIEDNPFVLSINPIHQFGAEANRAIMSRDETITSSPTRGTPLKMEVSGLDPYTETYRNKKWNIAKASVGEKWTFSIYAKADSKTTGELFIFEADENGNNIVNKAKTIELTTDWRRYDFTHTVTDGSAEYLQVRMDGPDDRESVQDVTIWWDGLQLEQAVKPSSFTRDPLVNRFAEQFNPIDLFNGTEVVNPEEGDWGWVTFNTGGRPAPETGMRVFYSIDGGSASSEDYLATKATLSTTDFKPQNYVTLAPQATEGKIYISALNDAIREGDESVTITLQPDIQTTSADGTSTSSGFSYQSYNIGEDNTETIKILDNKKYTSELIITPTGRTGLSTIRSDIGNQGEQTTSFDLHLASQPTDTVVVNLNTTSGTLSRSSITFSPADWDTSQTINLSEHSNSSQTLISASSISNDSFYDRLETDQVIVPSSWPEDWIVTMKEGGELCPPLPAVSVIAIDGSEDSNSQLGIRFNLSATTTEDIEVIYNLSPRKGFNLVGDNADIQQAPPEHDNENYKITIPAGSISASIALIPTDDLQAEGTEQLLVTVIPTGKYSIGGQTGEATVNLSDNDQASVRFSVSTDESIDSDNQWTETSQIRTSESLTAQGQSTSVGISLNSRPSQNVTLTLNESYSTSDLTITTSSQTKNNQLVFTPDNWDINQELKLQAIDEEIDDGDQSVQISFDVESADPYYSDLSAQISTIVVDNDATEADDNLADPEANSTDPLATLSTPSNTSITEGNSEASRFTISLEEPTEVDRVIFLTSDTNETTGEQSNITLKPDKASTVKNGLTLFGASAGGLETNYLQTSEINENKESFAELNLKGDFTATWSGYIYIPETGYYNFSTVATGGTRLRLNGQAIIDEYYDSDGEKTSDSIKLTAGDYASIQLDYRSFDSSEPKIELQWKRPSNNGTADKIETIPSSSFSRIGATHLIIEAGSSSTEFTVESTEDLIEEGDQEFAYKLLGARGTEIEVASYTEDSELNTTLGLTLGTTVHESLDLPAGTRLNLGAKSDAGTSQEETSAIFTLEETVTLHRDRVLETKGQLEWINPKADQLDLVGMVGADNSGQYQVRDAFVDLNLKSPLIALEASDNEYSTTLALADTNHPSLTIPAGTKLQYSAPDLNVELKLASALTVNDTAVGVYNVDLQRVDNNSDSALIPSGSTLTYQTTDKGDNFNLILQESLVFDSSNNTIGTIVQAEEVAEGLDLTSIPEGLSSTIDIPQLFTLITQDEIRLLSGEEKNNTILVASDISTGLDITTLEPGLSAAYMPANESIVQIKDNDAAGVRFTIDSSVGTLIDSNSSIKIAEGGDSVTRYASLTSQPTNSVTLYLETSDDTEVLLQSTSSSNEPAESRIELTFTPETWDQAQAFEIVPADDELKDGDISATIHSRTNSGDPFYQETNEYTIEKPKAINVVNTDDDISELIIEVQQCSIKEGGNSFINLSLSSQPKDDVNITLMPSDHQFTINQRGIGQKDAIKFTSANWQERQTIELKAVNDKTVEDITQSDLLITTSSNDEAYNKLNIEPTSVEIIDNDLSVASIVAVTDSTEEAEPGRFRVELSEPAPGSAGSKGILVNYTVTSISLDEEGLGYSADSDATKISKITQSPGVINGQVRIPPGETSSDVIVVPIDDFYADSIDKSFVVSLAEGDDYDIDKNNSNNSASIHIINNDIPGIVILMSGDTLQVGEDGEAGEFSIALLSQPADADKNGNPVNVEITITEDTSSGIKQLGSSGSEDYKYTLNFDSNNWFIAQTVPVQAYDDFLLEDSGENGELITYGDNGMPQPEGSEPTYSGLHPARLNYNFVSNDPNYSSKDNKDDHFTNMSQDVNVLDIQLPEETADSLQNALTNLQEGIDSLALPMVGSLTGKTGGGLRKFITNLSNSIRTIGTPTPAKLSEIITEEIDEATGLPVTVALSMDGTDAIDVSFEFADDYGVSIPLDAEFGLPGLGFQSQGDLEALFDYTAKLGFSFPREGEPALITDPETTGLNANFTIKPDEAFSLTGGLGFMQLDAVNQLSPNGAVVFENGDSASTEMRANFNLDLAGGAGAPDGDDPGSLTYTELTDSDTDLEDLFQYAFEGEAAMSFAVTTSVNGSAAIPSFSFDLSSLLKLFDYSNIEEEEENGTETRDNIFFDNITLDLGSYITQMVGPIVDGIDDILNPLYPVVDALYADTQIFDTIGLSKTFDKDKDGKVSPLDLAEWFADLYAMLQPGDEEAKKLKETIDATIEFVDVVKGVMDLIRDLDAMAEEGNFYVDFGSYTLEDFSAGDPNEKTQQLPPQDSSSDQSAPNLATDTQEQADAGGNSNPDDPDAGESSSKFAEVMAQLDELGFAIPLIDDPTIAINLLLGQGDDIDLFTWTMPEMGMSSEISESFPIYSGVDGIIEGGFGIDANIGFGFDTTGLEEWMDGGFEGDEFWKVFNGFYVNDRMEIGNEDVDIPEFTLDASMGAGLGLSAVVVRSDITGGLAAEASLDLLDEGEIAGTDDGKIYGDEITGRLGNPLDLFELIGSLSAYLKAKVQIGLDMGFYSIWDTVWQDKLAEIPIFEFGVGGSYGSGTASNGYLSGSTVFFDSNLNGRIDSLEPNTVLGDDSHYNLRVNHRDFDLNRNGSIDNSEGRLMVFGGKDSTTDLDLDLPMLAPLGEMITPLTTIHSLAQELGYKDKEIQKRLNDTFKLEDFDYLVQDPIREINSARSINTKGAQEAIKAYAAHIKLMGGLNTLSQTLKQIYHGASNTNDYEIALLKAFTEALFEQKPKHTDAAIRTALRNSIGYLHPDANQSNKRELKAIAKFAAKTSNHISDQINSVIRLHKTTPDSSSTNGFLEELNGRKADLMSATKIAIHGLSEGLYRISDPVKRFCALGSRLDVAYGDLLLQTSAKPTPDPSSGEELPPLIDLSAEELAVLSPCTIGEFTVDQVFALSNDAIGALKRKQVKQLSPAAVSALSKSQASELSTNAVMGFSADHIQQINKRTFRALDTDQLTGLSKNGVTGLTSSQLRTLTGDELAAFKPGLIKSITPESIYGLRPAALDELSKRQVKAFTKDQLAGLSQKQIQKSDDFIDALSNQQREALSVDPVHSNRLVDPFSNRDELSLLPGLDPLD